MDEYLSADATTLAGHVASGEVTAAELLDLARARADAVNPSLNAIVIRMDAEADARVRSDLTGPFAGVPFLIKDLAQDYRGYPTTRGSRALATHIAREHSFGVRRSSTPASSSSGRRTPPSSARRPSPNPPSGDRRATPGTST